VLSREESEAEQAVARPQVTVIPREQHAISRKDISENALKVMYRLNKAGYEAWLVGGGALTTPVNEAMTVGGTTLQSQSRAIDAKEILMKRKITAAPVVDENGKLTGAINLQDFYQAGII